MQNILIGNLSNRTQPATQGKRIRCDRQSPLGNPFYMPPDGKLRDVVCDCFDEYCDLIVSYNYEPGYAAQRVLQKFRKTCPELKISSAWEKPSRTSFMNAFTAIKPGDMLMCHCYPERCHCESLRDQRLSYGDLFEQGYLY